MMRMSAHPYQCDLQEKLLNKNLVKTHVHALHSSIEILVSYRQCSSLQKYLLRRGVIIYIKETKHFWQMFSQPLYIHAFLCICVCLFRHQDLIIIITPPRRAARTQPPQQPLTHTTRTIIEIQVSIQPVCMYIYTL